MLTHNGSYLRNIEGVIEHSYYHLGQISLIKKMISRSIITKPGSNWVGNVTLRICNEDINAIFKNLEIEIFLVIFVIMEAYVVYPENKEQLSALKAVLKALKINFEPQVAVPLPPHVIEGMKRGIEDLDNGRKIPFSEFEELLTHNP